MLQARDVRIRNDRRAKRGMRRAESVQSDEITLELPGARWEFTVTWPTLSPDDRRELAAFLARLRFGFSAGASGAAASAAEGSGNTSADSQAS